MVELLGIALGALGLALLLTASLLHLTRRFRRKPNPQDGWMTDDLVQQIIDLGVLSERQVPEEALDLEEIAKEEKRFWSETWDEPDRLWE